jgi:hypothetical protein
MTSFDIAIQGLDEFAVGQPLIALADWINQNTPVGVHFNVVGGIDPQLQQASIEQSIVDAAGRREVPILIGHSKGAMEAFYAADRMKLVGIRSPLFVSIDSTGWGTNAPGIPQWSTIVLPPNTGRWFVPDSVDVWIHAYQDGLPGGGIAALAPGNTHTALQIIHCPQENHISIVNCAPVRKAILAAVLAATK